MEDSGNTTAVRVAGVRKSFKTHREVPVRALRGAELDVVPGEFVAAMGPSGSGKSTLLNVIAGLEQPEEGLVEVAGETVTGRSEDDLARFRRDHVGMVFQSANLIDQLTVVDNVALPAAVAGFSRSEADSRARDLLGLLGLTERADDLPDVLSGGERQRVAIARAMANEPTVLLADEPTGALDSAGAAEIMALFQRLNRSGQTIVMVTHDVNVAAAAGRIVRIDDGRLVNGDVTAGDESPQRGSVG